MSSAGAGEVWYIACSEKGYLTANLHIVVTNANYAGLQYHQPIRQVSPSSLHNSEGKQKHTSLTASGVNTIG